MKYGTTFLAAICCAALALLNTVSAYGYGYGGHRQLTGYGPLKVAMNEDNAYGYGSTYYNRGHGGYGGISYLSRGVDSYGTGNGFGYGGYGNSYYGNGYGNSYYGNDNYGYGGYGGYGSGRSMYSPSYGYGGYGGGYGSNMGYGGGYGSNMGYGGGYGSNMGYGGGYGSNMGYGGNNYNRLGGYDDNYAFGGMGRYRYSPGYSYAY